MLLHISAYDHHQGSSYLGLAKVTIVKISVKIRCYKLCSGVAAYYVKSVLVCMQCEV
jgi:hypothetical protein